MNPLNIAVVLVAMIVATNASGLGLGVVGIGLNPAAHIPSGSIGVSVKGAVIAGPSGSVRTDNGLGGHGAGAQLSGPAGDVRTRGGAVQLDGPGIGHGGIALGVPAVIAAPIGKIGLGIGGLGLGGLGGVGLGGLGGVGLGGIGLGGGLGLGGLGHL